MKLRLFLPLLGFLIPTLVIGYGFVIPRSCIAGVNELTIGFATNEIDVGPNPEHVYAHDNTYENTGYDADPFVKDMLGKGFDIIWDTSGADNYFDENVSSSFPPILPQQSWPQPLYNL